MRAFAVAAVLLYHGGVPGIGGGLLGVDVFFVLSGFLITCLLCGEYSASATIRLGRFWAGRARRLLPALFLLLLGVALYTWIFKSTLDVSGIRGDALATLLYVTNWHFVLTGQSYFDQSTTPSPLLHMWSLSVEEQYYLIWPLVALFVLRRHGARGVAWVALVGAAASVVLMAWMYEAGFSIDRLYYGTDTRAQSLLVGSVLGAVASQRQWSVISGDRVDTTAGRILGAVLGTAGAGFLLWAFHAFNGQAAFLYHGGFFVVALASGAVITAVTSWRTSVLAAFLSLRPLTYIGRISYGLYLYHWPLFLALDHAHTGLSGLALLSVRLASTFAVSVASFHLVEEPVRKGRLARTWPALAMALGGAALSAVVIVAATVPLASAAVPATATTKGAGLSPAQHRALAAANAFGSDPVRVLWLGDSLAATAYSGLRVDSVPRYGVKLYEGAVLGFTLTLTPSRLGGVVSRCDPGFDCGSWQTIWSKDVAENHPEVVGVLFGRFELADHFYEGRWVHVGQPVWDDHIEGLLKQAVSILTAGGAHLVLYTFPYIDPPVEQANGSPFPENEPSRVDAWNGLLRQAAADQPASVSLVDLNRMLDPNGHFTDTVDGVGVRWADDGIHITYAGGLWLQPRLLPELGKLGLEVRSSQSAAR
jgi:peptidoglycan/LPS O-acetylase OafA/YrhL